MRFDLFGFSRSRIANPPGVNAKRKYNWYVSLFFLHVKRKVDPLNPFKRTAFSLLLIAKQYNMVQNVMKVFWQVEVLFIVFVDDKKKLSKQLFAEQMEKGLRSRPKKFTDRVKSAARW